MFKNNKKSLQKRGNKNPMWKGDNVGFNALHRWIKIYKTKTDLCECCLVEPPYDLANISQKYNKKTYTRDLKNWEWLCRGCHMRKDARIDNLLRTTEKGKNNPNWKGGKPKCLDCKKELSNYNPLRCSSCSKKGDLNPKRYKQKYEATLEQNELKADLKRKL